MNANQTSNNALNRTPDICKDNFRYSDGRFLADGEFYCDTRMESKQLHDLLTRFGPGGRSGGGDQPARFYSAQMVHYGLKPLKTREPSKKKLLAAYNGGTTLAVPPDILALEAAMKKEWDAAEQQRLAEIEASKARSQKQKTQAILPDSEPCQRAGMKQTVTKSDSGNKRLIILRAREALETVKPTIEEVEAKIRGLSHVQALGLILLVMDAVPGVEKAVAKRICSRETKGGKPQGAKLKLKDWVGSYAVESRELAEEWDLAHRPATFQVYPSSSSRHFWASFDFGILYGVMRSVQGLPSKSGEEVRVVWKGKCAGEGVSIFGRNNVGKLQFFGKGLVKGKLRGFNGSFRFSGGIDKGDTRVKDLQAVKEAKAEWRSINAHNEEMENANRWGNSWAMQREEDESAFESDTTNGHHKIDGDFDDPSSEDNSNASDEGEEDYW